MNTIANDTITKSNGNSVLNQFKTSRLLQLCVAVLVAQLGLAALLGLTQKKATFANNEPLFTLNEDQINHIAIDNGDDTVNLKKQDKTWQIDGDVLLPVDSARLNTLIGSLVNLKAGLPVARSINAREQLQVADNRYQRKLVVNNDATNTLLLGTSPGLRKAHLRREGDNRIYSAPLPVSDTPASVDQWLDKSLLGMTDISRLVTNVFTFERSGTGDDEIWSAPDNTDDSQSLDTEKLTTVIKALENLRVTGLAELPVSHYKSENTETVKEATDEETSTALETVELTVTSDGTELQLVLQKADNNTIVQRSDINQAFAAPASVFDQLSVLASKTGWLVDVDKQSKTEEKAEVKTEE